MISARLCKKVGMRCQYWKSQVSENIVEFREKPAALTPDPDLLHFSTGPIQFRIGRWTLEIVKRSDVAKGFEVLPRRWVVERTLAWLNRNRRLAKDFEATIASAEAWIMIASIQLMVRRLVRP